MFCKHQVKSSSLFLSTNRLKFVAFVNSCCIIFLAVDCSTICSQGADMENVKICKECGKEFKRSAKNRSLVCPVCKHNKQRVKCSTCDNLVFAGTLQCLKCHRLNHPQSGEFNKNWKGGKTKHKKGYVLVLAKEHARASGNNVYVFEHILVMEEVLGRYLLPGENVYHKNGIKDDNRPENLELWVTKQPSGQRPEDLVSWAEEILKLYAPEKLA